MKFEGTPTFLDVEGMPDRDFYYLIGLRFECGGEQVERSFWADGLDGEREIWEVSLQRTFGKFDSALPEFTKINDAAYWDYQRSKVYARTDRTVRRSVRKSRGSSNSATVEKEVTVEDVPDKCPRCRAQDFGFTITAYKLFLT
ncbi:MAG: hypothetical protein WBW73_13795 [Rhodoplanes sp.]